MINYETSNYEVHEACDYFKETHGNNRNASCGTVLTEKVSTQEGWSFAAPDEFFTMGYQGEIQDFVTAAAGGPAPQSDLELALDTTAAIYAAYVSAEQRGAEIDIERL